MLAATAAALSRSALRSAVVASRIAASASSALEQASLASSGGERSHSTASSSSSSSSTAALAAAAAAAASTTSTSTSTSALSQARCCWSSSSCHGRSFSASPVASSSEAAAGKKKKGGEGTGGGGHEDDAPSTSDSPSSTSSSSPSSSTSEEAARSDSSWSNPMPSLEAIDDFLDEWGRLLDEGDSEGVLRLLEERTAAAPGLPPLEEVWASATAADDERAARRAHEAAAQLEQASRRLRLVDAQGRSYATGRRKEAVARVWLRPAAAGAAAGRVWVNGAPLDAAFPSAPTSRAADVLAPFVVTRTVGAFDVRATVSGGGPTGQAQAVRHGIARALQLWAPEARAALKAAGLLTRDSRSVERKKPGRAKARKAFQWVKR